MCCINDCFIEFKLRVCCILELFGKFGKFGVQSDTDKRVIFYNDCIKLLREVHHLYYSKVFPLCHPEFARLPAGQVPGSSYFLSSFQKEAKFLPVLVRTFVLHFATVEFYPFRNPFGLRNSPGALVHLS